MLRDAQSSNSRVRVVTRHGRGVRGVAEGYLRVRRHGCAPPLWRCRLGTALSPRKSRAHGPKLPLAAAPALPLTTQGYDRFFNLILADVQETYSVLLKLRREAADPAQVDSRGNPKSRCGAARARPDPLCRLTLCVVWWLV